MPSQTAPVGTNIEFYGQWDTAPDLDYIIRTPRGDVVDLTDADSVYITVAWRTFTTRAWGSYRKIIVDRALCVITDAVTGAIAWTPADGDLSVIGEFQFSFEVKWNNGTVSTHKALSYDYITIPTPPGGSRSEMLP